jgi:hypothetical protein
VTTNQMASKIPVMTRVLCQYSLCLSVSCMCSSSFIFIAGSAFMGRKDREGIISGARGLGYGGVRVYPPPDQTW